MRIENTSSNDFLGKIIFISRSEKFRSFLYQSITIAFVAGILSYFVLNTAQNLEARGIASGFDFLNRSAGYDISFTLIPFSRDFTHASAFLVGLLNTLLVSAIGIVLATILGFTVGVFKLSNNWLLRKVANAYSTIFHNTPLVLQIIFWYALLTQLPGPRESIYLGANSYISNRGLQVPALEPQSGFIYVMASFAIAIVVAIGFAKYAKKRQMRTGETLPVFLINLGILILFPLLVTFAAGVPFTFEIPELTRFKFQGGVSIGPEFVGLLLGLTLYSGTYVSEIVRAGIQSVSHGQTEAAYSLGLSSAKTTRLIILPQALRVVVPPLTTEYLNLLKNSSLGVAIAYPELVSTFGGTTLNVTGQAVEAIALTMSVYLTISICISIFMNWYNKRVALTER